MTVWDGLLLAGLLVAGWLVIGLGIASTVLHSRTGNSISWADIKSLVRPRPKVESDYPMPPSWLMEQYVDLARSSRPHGNIVLQPQRYVPVCSWCHKPDCDGKHDLAPLLDLSKPEGNS